MSQLKVNALVSYSGNTVTLGTSGDTINVASGVTFNTGSATVTLPSTINATTINVTTLVLAAGAVGTPSLTTSGDTNTGIFFPAADTIGFAEGGTEAMRINSSANVGIGATSPRAKTDIFNSSVSGVFSATNLSTWRVLQVRNNIDLNTGTAAGIALGGDVDNDTSTAGIVGINDNSTGGICQLAFLTAAGNESLERMRIDSSGNVLVAQSSTATPGLNNTTQGACIDSTGRGFFSVNGAWSVFNRNVDDGDVILISQAGTVEGTISVSGTTVSYNGFTGSHWSRFIDESKPDVLRGTVMESLDQMTDWYHVEFEASHTEKDKDGNDVVKTTIEKKPYALKAGEQEGDVITYNWNTGKKDEDDNDIIEQVQATIVKQVDVKHVMSKISDTSEAKNVYGVFSAWDNDDLINNDFYVASVGSYVVRIKAGQTVSKGDLLQSNGDGTAKVQADDIIRASTFAKVLSNTVIKTYEDGSFIVPCSLMC